MNNRSKNPPKLLMGLLLVLVTSGCNLNDLINPTPKVTAVKLNTEAVSLEVGETVALSAIVYGDPSHDVRWQTSNSKVATVERGEVSALAPGEVRITALSTYDPTKFAFADVTIVSGEQTKRTQLKQ